ncbi:MAG TPA: hypothetical protein VLM89_07610, partial [Phycisphaerae bacterium]|nr:hypothetical protein [Phycisphaerae bacterium]
EQPSSGLTVRAWCHRHRVQAASFHWWRREMKRRDREKRPASFVPVSVIEDDRDDDRSRIEQFNSDPWASPDAYQSPGQAGDIATIGRNRFEKKPARIKVIH